MIGSRALAVVGTRRRSALVWSLAGYLAVGSWVAGVVGASPAAAAAATTSRVFSDSCADAAPHGFADAPTRSVHGEAIACLRHTGITIGSTARAFDPGQDLTRAQLASFLARTLDAAGVGLATPAGDFFADLVGSPHREAINRLAAAGILPVERKDFGGGQRVDRAETATTTAAALRYAGVLPRTAEDHFADDAGHRAERDINDLAHAGVAAGRSAGEFSPGSLLRRDQLASFLVRGYDLIVDGGSAPEGRPVTPVVGRSPEGWVVAGGDGPRVGTSGTTTRYSVEVADGLERRQDVTAFARFVEVTLSDGSHGWTARGGHRLQRVGTSEDARVRVVLATPATVDRLCAQAGLRTRGTYSCWNGRVAAINSDRWFDGVSHVDELGLYRTYLINHEVGHGLGQGHRSCPEKGRLAPVMMQLSKSAYGCVPNGVPYP